MFRPRRLHDIRLFQSHGRRSVTVRPAPRPCLASHHGAPTWTQSVPLHARGKKTKTTLKLSDLPQGAIKTEPTPLEDDQNGPVYPTVVLQARRNMHKFDNCVLLTRVGGFYELYFEHAEEYAPLLNIKLASKKTSAGPVPMVLAPSLPKAFIMHDHEHEDAHRFHLGWLSVLPAGPLPQGPGPGSKSLRRHRRGVSQRRGGQDQVRRLDARPQSRAHHYAWDPD